MTRAEASQGQLPRWGLVRALREGVRTLFPTRRTRTAMWGVVGLGVLITYLELLAVQFFSSLITNLGNQSLARSALVLGGFIVTFAAIKGVGYFQSVYRLTVFEKSLRKIISTSRAAEAWRWPLAIDMVGMLQQIARIAIVIVTVAAVSWEFGLLLLLCSVVAVLIVNRTGKRQYVVHQDFATQKRQGAPPSAAERISTRIKAGERAGLVAVGPVLVFIAALGAAAAVGRVAVEDALVLFIAGRMVANMYGTLSSSTMRFIRAQVNVEDYGGTPPGGQPATNGAAPTGAPSMSDAEILEAVTAGGYLVDTPSQAFVRLVDDGLWVGDLQTLGRLAREQGFAPDGSLRRRSTPVRPDRVVAVEPNQAWWIEAFVLPVGDGASHLQIVLDVYSRCILGWRICGTDWESSTGDLLAETAAREGVSTDDVELISPRTLPSQVPTLHDMLKFLGVVRTLLWRGTRAPGNDRAARRPAFPIGFPSVDAATSWVERFTAWYNHDYYQPDVGYLHPRDVHAGLSEVITARRRDHLDSAHRPGANPFAHGVPTTWIPPQEAWVEPMGITTIPMQVDEATESDMMEDEEL